MYVVKVTLIYCLTVLVRIVKLESVDCPDIENISVTIYKKQFHAGIAGGEEIISGCIEAGKFSSTENFTEIIIECSEKTVLKKLGANYVRNMLHLKSIHIDSCPIADIEPWAFKNVPNLTTIWLDGKKHLPEAVQVLKRDIFNVIFSLNEIYINNLNIIHIKEGAFSNLPKLNLISLHQNKLGIIDENWFSTSNNIEHLLLSDNLIQFIPNSVFRYLSNLLYLHLEYNQVISIDMEAFKDLTSLYYLYLNNNLIKNIQKAVFKPLSNLVYLHLGGNQIISIEDGTFQGLTNLSNLLLNNNLIKSIQRGVFNDLSNLRSLIMSYNQIVSIEAHALDRLINLRYLNLRNNLIQIIESGLFKYLSKLEELSLEDNQITSIESGAFQGLTSLQGLRIGNNKIVFISEEVLADISNISFISLKSNELNYFSEAFLEKSIKNNLRLEVGGNPLICSCLDFVLSWMYKNNIKTFFNYILNNYPVCVVDRNNTKVCPMTVQPRLTTYYKFKLFDYK